VGERARIDDDAVTAADGLVEAIDDLAFMVGLEDADLAPRWSPTAVRLSSPRVVVP
jgi:hypothetical protein